MGFHVFAPPTGIHIQIAPTLKFGTEGFGEYSHEDHAAFRLNSSYGVFRQNPWNGGGAPLAYGT